MMSGAMGAMGGMGNMMDSWLHPERGYQDAGKTMEGYYRDAQGNLQPYNQNGQDQYGRLNGQANALNDPTQLENQWANSYTESPYAKQMEAKATGVGMDQASAMGLMGSSAALNNVQQSAGDIMQSDRQQYMNDLMNKYMASVGIGENMYGVGANAANQQSKNAMDEGTAQGGAAYGAANAPGSQFGGLLGTIINGGINYATGGMGGAAKAAA
jgi:hypothetical protein